VVVLADDQHGHKPGHACEHCGVAFNRTDQIGRPGIALVTPKRVGLVDGGGYAMHVELEFEPDVASRLLRAAAILDCPPQGVVVELAMHALDSLEDAGLHVIKGDKVDPSLEELARMVDRAIKKGNTETCPRCGDPYDRRMPAASRVTDDRDIAICGRCGGEEALLDAAGRPLPPPSDWPLFQAESDD
jgi:uncharacterized protein (DUF983 family)